MAGNSSNPNNNDANQANASDASANAGNASSNSNARPQSISEALRLLDEALAGQAANLRELVTTDFENIRQAMGSSSMNADTLRQVGDRLRDIGTTFATSATQQFGNVRDYGTQTYGRVSEAAAPAFEKTREAYTELDRQVRANPWPILGGVAVGTLALGFMLGRGSAPNTSEEI